MSDLKDFQEGMKELFQEVGTSSILFYPLDNSTPTNIYNESKGMKYLDPISLVGSLEWLSEDDELNIGNSIKHPYLEIKVPLLSLLENNLSRETLTKGLVSFNDITYQVFDVVPTGYFLGDYTYYLLKCKKKVK